MADPKGLLTPAEIQELREKTLRAMAPLKPAIQSQSYVYGSKKTQAGSALPAYYLIYFLLVELLGFPRGMREEKLAWSIAVDFEGNLAFIEYRKFGLGIFSPGTAKDEQVASKIVICIQKGLKAAAPFFAHLVAEAMQRAELNVNNQSRWLFARYQYMRDQFTDKLAESEVRKNETRAERHPSRPGSIFSATVSFTGVKLRKEAAWIGVAAIEAFFSWTEHILIHIAILQGKIRTAEGVTQCAFEDWPSKIKRVLDLKNFELKKAYDELLIIRNQIRNYMAHGAFGKQGEAFQFHSSAGAVPVSLTNLRSGGRFSIFGEPSFEELDALRTAEAFIDQIWRGDLAPAKIYIQDAGLPLILPYAADGTYSRAMASIEEMEQLVNYIAMQMDNAANMDW